MVRTIKLFSNYGKYCEGSEILKEDENMTLNINYEKPKDAEFYFTAFNGLSTLQGQVKRGQVVIPEEFIKEGYLALKLDLSVNSKVVRHFKIENLIIKQLPNQVETIPEMEDLKNRQRKLEEEVSALRNNINLFIQLWKEDEL